MKVDEKDRRLLAILTGSGRVSNRELARRIGLSPSACLSRVRRLEQAGVIVGYRAVVALAGGSQLEGWADVRLFDPTPDSTDRFVGLLKGTPEIIEAHRIAGHYDYVIRFCAGDISAWKLFQSKLEAIGCQAQARFSVLLEPLKLA